MIDRALRDRCNKYADEQISRLREKGVEEFPHADLLAVTARSGFKGWFCNALAEAVDAEKTAAARNSQEYSRIHRS
jgi:hypothetical protein